MFNPNAGHYAQTEWLLLLVYCQYIHNNTTEKCCIKNICIAHEQVQITNHIRSGLSQFLNLSDVPFHAFCMPFIHVKSSVNN